MNLYDELHSHSKTPKKLSKTAPKREKDERTSEEELLERRENFGRTPPNPESPQASLREWAETSGRKIDPLIIPELPLLSFQTTEHFVHYHPQKDKAFKILKPETFGMTVCPDTCQIEKGNLEDYLQRIQLTKEVFQDEYEIEGVLEVDDFILENTRHPCLVISQPWRHAKDPKHPCPEDHEIENFMRNFGFQPTGRNYGWARKEDGVVVADARKDNFIKTENGIFPIDLLISQKEVQPN